MTPLAKMVPDPWSMALLRYKNDFKTFLAKA